MIQTSESPVSLFAFEYYRSFLAEFEAETNSGGGASSSMDTTEPDAGRKKKQRRIGRGHKKALVKWYSSKSELELMTLVTKHKHSHSWTNKDLFKLIHMKPKSEGVEFVVKYVLFGFNKVKDDKLSENFAYLSAFVNDLENVCI